MQGTISVRSTPGAGSEFTVDLPLVTAPMPPGRALTSVTDLSGVEVLAVIPNDCCSSLCRSYLSAAGAKVSVVGDIEAARRHVEQSSGNLVLLLDMAEEFGNATSGEAGNPATMTWPDRVRVVQLAKRGDPGATNGHIEVPARPLLYRDLIRGVAVASGTRQGVDGDVRIEKRQSLGPPAPSVGQSVMTGELILLAEDNETNREVMLAQLRMLGYACEVAEDGVVALAKWRTGRYALLLTDCHMPNMDGFELTTSIRKDELAQGQDRHAPIIAVTANAMQGEAERCRERGMDDYLAKPLRLNELASMLARWLPLPSADSLPTTETIADAVSPAPTFAGVVWDATVLPKMVGNNPAMQRRLLDKFILSAADQVTRIGTAAATGDFATIADVAHSLKSAARTVGALQLGNLCEELEDTRRSGDARLVQTLNEQLPTAFAAASGEIRRHLEQAQ
jgi:CheY-like chemotaxis protein/HPt (histidine-containing phosphotransfer) domain-containing protein